MLSRKASGSQSVFSYNSVVVKEMKQYRSLTRILFKLDAAGRVYPALEGAPYSLEESRVLKMLIFPQRNFSSVNTNDCQSK